MEIDSPHEAWPRRCSWPACLHEAADREIPPERLLQAVWFHQRLRREGLRGVDGRALRVLHPGFWNREAGPDFRRALIQWEGEEALQGDVEVDLHPSGWHTHGHAGNPGFAGVILHVVWRADEGVGWPTLELEPHLEVPVPELERWHASSAAGRWPTALSGRCRSPLQVLDPELQSRLLQEAAAARLRIKAGRMALRAGGVGWDQALWEFLFRALGYKQNPWPMQRLGELMPRLRDPSTDPRGLLGRLLGVAGLLPVALPATPGVEREYGAAVWEEWLGSGRRWEEWRLPRALWRLHNLRPANRPERRLALAAHWVHEGLVPTRLRAWGEADLRAPRGCSSLVTTLREALRVPEDEFWSGHWTLRARAPGGRHPMLGLARLTDIAVNVVLPWLWAQAGELGREELERRYFLWPRAQDNAVLRLARDRLLGGVAPRTRRAVRAADQQGLMQIVSDFCEHSDSLCRHCPFPRLVADYGG
ncbi:MAG TPA: hypothetical protein DCM86_05095 [Verrucomicrobiales bacterium]|nr:hypothetical protein [Verrucomicrobiales bacterium]